MYMLKTVMSVKKIGVTSTPKHYLSQKKMWTIAVMVIRPMNPIQSRTKFQLLFLVSCLRTCLRFLRMLKPYPARNRRELEKCTNRLSSLLCSVCLWQRISWTNSCDSMVNPDFVQGFLLCSFQVQSSFLNLYYW